MKVLSEADLAEYYEWLHTPETEEHLNLVFAQIDNFRALAADMVQTLSDVRSELTGSFGAAALGVGPDREWCIDEICSAIAKYRAAIGEGG